MARFGAHSEILDLDFCWYEQDREFDVLDPDTGRTIDPLEVEREARQAERLAFEARERQLLAEINRLRSRQNGN